MSDPIRRTWCPQCGPDVACDEDGCCAACGADCIGEGAEKALTLLAASELLLPQLRAMQEVEQAVREAFRCGIPAKLGIKRRRARGALTEVDRRRYDG